MISNQKTYHSILNAIIVVLFFMMQCVDMLAITHNDTLNVDKLSDSLLNPQSNNHLTFSKAICIFDKNTFYVVNDNEILATLPIIYLDIQTQALSNVKPKTLVIPTTKIAPKKKNSKPISPEPEKIISPLSFNNVPFPYAPMQISSEVPFFAIIPTTPTQSHKKEPYIVSYISLLFTNLTLTDIKQLISFIDYNYIVNNKFQNLNTFSRPPPFVYDSFFYNTKTEL